MYPNKTNKKYSVANRERDGKKKEPFFEGFSFRKGYFFFLRKKKINRASDINVISNVDIGLD